MVCMKEAQQKSRSPTIGTNTDDATDDLASRTSTGIDNKSSKEGRRGKSMSQTSPSACMHSKRKSGTPGGVLSQSKISMEEATARSSEMETIQRFLDSSIESSLDATPNPLE